MRRMNMKKIKKMMLIVLVVHLLIIPQMAFCEEDDFPIYLNESSVGE
ncbi:hypothetical protein [Fusibacter bizertensis]